MAGTTTEVWLATAETPAAVDMVAVTVAEAAGVTAAAAGTAMLMAAEDLGRVPRGPPMRLRSVTGFPGQFIVDVVPQRRLRFGAPDGDASEGSWEGDLAIADASIG